MHTLPVRYAFKSWEWQRMRCHYSMQIDKKSPAILECRGKIWGVLEILWREAGYIASLWIEGLERLTLCIDLNSFNSPTKSLSSNVNKGANS